MPPDDTVEAYLASEMEMNQDRVLRERRKREKEEREREEREREILRAQHEYRVSQAIIQAPAYKPAGKYRSIDNKSVAERARAQHQAKLRKEGRQNDSGVGSDGEEFDGGAGSGALRGTIPFETASDRLKRERREKARKQQQQLRQGGGVGRGDEDPDAQAILSAAAAASGSGRSAAARRPRVSGLLRSAGGSGSARPLVRPASSAAGEENDGRKENDGNAGEGRYRNGNGKHAGHPSRPASSPGSGGARRTPPSGGAHAGDGRGSGESEKDGEGRGGMEQAIIDRIEREIVDNASNPVTFEDIAGLEFVKQSVTETVVFPMARPDIFQGLRAQAQGVLLFGPPGTGKTLIGKAIAYECGATFFSISASSLTSKWVGEGEKAVKCLFMVAHERQPSVVFIDEVDSLLCQRSNDENEGSRRIKTEFLVQLDGVQTNTNDLVLIMGATNRPQELDEAARRRFAKRLYVPLPDATGRACLIHKLLQGTGKTQHSLSVDELAQVVEKTKGFSGADIKALCSEAAMGPVREILARARVGAPARSASRNSGAADASTSRSSSRNGRTAASAAAAAEAAGSGENLVSGARSMLKSVSASDVKAIEYRHFEEALRSVSRSVSRADLDGYLAFNNEFGAHGADAAEEVPDDAVAAATAAAALFGCGGEGEEETEVLSA